MTGRRVFRTDPTSLEGIEPGDYWLSNGTWYAACPVPRDEYGMVCLASMANHSCTEHEDGTLTVSPSILVSAPWGPTRAVKEFYHGFLEHGIWRTA